MRDLPYFVVSFISCYHLIIKYLPVVDNMHKINDLLAETIKEDGGFKGLMVFDMKKGDVLSSTFDEKHAKTMVKVEKKFFDLESGEVEKLDPSGAMNWVMSSFERKVVFDVRITDDVFLYGECEPMKAPTTVIEDALELALMIGRVLK